MQSAPTISVILCTFNNADSLQITLSQLADCGELHAGPAELICVDNNSSDHTEQICEQWAQHATLAITCLRETRQGLSHARNTGVGAARGEYVLFTDDDASIPADWIAKYLDHIAQQRPTCLYSRIAVQWDRPQPWWYRPEYRPFFVELDYGPQAMTVTDREHEFYGKNFAIRRDTLEQLGGFDPKLGRMGDKLVAGEETLIYRRLVEGGESLLYFPGALVGHRLKAREYEVENLRNLYVGSAASRYHQARVTARRRLLGRPVYPLRLAAGTLVQAGLGFAGAVLRGDASARLLHRLELKRALLLLGHWLQDR